MDISLHVFVMIWIVFKFRLIDMCDVSNRTLWKSYQSNTDTKCTSFLDFCKHRYPVHLLCNCFRPPRLRAEQFVPGNQEHVKILKSMGITVVQTKDGRIQLMQSAASVR